MRPDPWTHHEATEGCLEHYTHAHGIIYRYPGGEWFGSPKINGAYASSRLLDSAKSLSWMKRAVIASYGERMRTIKKRVAKDAVGSIFEGGAV